MKHNYQFMLIFKLNQPFNLDYVNKIANQYPNSKVLVEVQNTKGITSFMLRQLSSNILLRIAGGYDEKRVTRNKDYKFANGETGEYYFNSVIYTRNEAIKIIEEIEKIEDGINKKWSNIQKVIYIYERLKSSIMYDPKFEKQPSDEIRNLKGLITKKTVCAGYAMILKELMDRLGIECEYVEGRTHAWNIITIDGKKYPIDLTWDNAKFRAGHSKTFDFLGQNAKQFSETHCPSSHEKTQNYEVTLSEINPQLIKKIYSQISRERVYSSTIYHGTRKDGSKYIVAQIGDATIDNTKYYRYYYVDISSDGKKSLPLILYSETNLTRLIDCKSFNKSIPNGYEDAVTNILFSRENINDSIAKKTYYIGKVRKDGIENKVELVSSYKEIEKPIEKRNLFMYQTRRLTRSDKSNFIAQQMYSFQIQDINIICYHIFEMITENGKHFLKRNIVFTERDFFKDPRQSMIDDYLSRERLDRKVSETGGYIGYYDNDETRILNPDLVMYFETSKTIDDNSFKK